MDPLEHENKAYLVRRVRELEAENAALRKMVQRGWCVESDVENEYYIQGPLFKQTGLHDTPDAAIDAALICLREAGKEVTP